MTDLKAFIEEARRARAARSGREAGVVSWYDRHGLRVVEGRPFFNTPHGPPAASESDFRHAVVRLRIVMVGR